MTGQHEN